MNEASTIIISGRLGQKPEISYTAKSEAVCNFSVAENIKGSEIPKWHKVVAWGKLAELCSAQLGKGTAVFVRGRTQEKEFTNSTGELKRYTELKADTVGISLA